MFRGPWNTIATWDTPGPGSYYDSVGDIGKMPHVQREQSLATDPIGQNAPYPTWWWLDNGLSRLRLSWQVTMDFPEAVVYAGIDPNATYKVRLTGYGQMLLKIDGERVQGDRAKIEHGDFVEFDVPPRPWKIVASNSLGTTPPTRPSSTGASAPAWPRRGC